MKLPPREYRDLYAQEFAREKGCKAYIFTGKKIRKVSLTHALCWLKSEKFRLMRTVLYGDKVRVSTIFLFLDASFETMVLGGPLNSSQVHTRTLEDALLAHLEWSERAAAAGSESD